MYTIRFDGWGGRYIVGTISKEMFDYFKQNNLNITDYMNGNLSVEIPNDITNGISPQNKSNVGDLININGPFVDYSTKMTIHHDEDGVLGIITALVDNKENGLLTFYMQKEIKLEDFQTDYVIVGEELTKGFHKEYTLPESLLENGHLINKYGLALYYIKTHDGISLCSNITYGNNILEHTDEELLVTKDCRWFLQNNKTGERI